MATHGSMQKNKDRFEHGEHNEAVCDFLEIKKDFSDWIITTAFYASLQFVTHKIFPFETSSISGGKTKINSIEDFHNYQSNRNANKHHLLADLVGKHCIEISEDYDWLLDFCMKARYVQYQYPVEIGNKARTLMKKIKKHCTR